MTDYTKLIEALRCGTKRCGKCSIKDCGYFISEPPECDEAQICDDAADAIESLEQAVARKQERIEELEEKQTIIDHYGQKWMTSAKDVPEAAYKHGFIDGQAETQLPNHGEWIELEDRNERKYSHICSVCHRFNIEEGEVKFYHYCPNCGAKMEAQDGQS